MQKRTPSLAVKTRLEYGLGSASVSLAISARGARNGCALNKVNSDAARDRYPDRLPCPALG
ncbi:hypothetical protein D3C77_72970 [compost metagenome]